MLKNNIVILYVLGTLFSTSCISSAAAEYSNDCDTKTYLQNESSLWDLQIEDRYLQALNTLDTSGNWKNFKPFAEEIIKAAKEAAEQRLRENKKKEKVLAASKKFGTCGFPGTLYYAERYLEQEGKKQNITRTRSALLELAKDIRIELINKELLAKMNLAENCESGISAFIAQKFLENDLAKKELEKYVSSFTKEYFEDEHGRCGYTIVKR